MTLQKDIYTSHQFDISLNYQKNSILVNYKQDGLYADIFFDHAKTYINFFNPEIPYIIYAQGHIFENNNIWKIKQIPPLESTNAEINEFIEKIIPLISYLYKEISFIKNPLSNLNIKEYSKNQEEITYLYTPDFDYNQTSKFVSANVLFQISKDGKMTYTVTELDNSNIINLPLHIQNFIVTLKKEINLSQDEINYLFNIKTSQEKCQNQLKEIFKHKINPLLSDPFINKEKYQTKTWIKGTQEEFEKVLFSLTWLLSKSSEDKEEAYIAKYICPLDDTQKPELNIYGLDFNTTIQYYDFLKIICQKYIAIGWEIIQEYAGKPNHESDYVFVTDIFKYKITKPSSHQIIDSKIYLKKWIEENLEKDSIQYQKIIELFNNL